MADTLAAPPGFTLDQAPPAGFTLDPVGAGDVSRETPLTDQTAFDPDAGRNLAEDMRAQVMANLNRQPEQPVAATFLNSTFVGGTLNAFGQGAKDRWGDGPLISPETESGMKKLGWLYDPNQPLWMKPISTFNEVMIRPAATALAVVMRATDAAIGGGARAAAEAVAGRPRAGLTENEARNVDDRVRSVARDFYGMAEMAMLVSGTPEFEASAAARAPRVAKARPERITLSDGENTVTLPHPIHPDAYIEAQSLGILKDGGAIEDTLGRAAADLPEPAPPGPGAHTPFQVLAARAEQPRQISAPLMETATIDKAGNIRLDNLNRPDDVKQIFRDAAEQNAGFITARRGVQSDAQREAAAEALGIDPAAFKPINADNVPWSVWTEYVKRTAIESADRTFQAMRKAAATGAEEDLIAYAEAKARHQMIQEEFSRVTAEGGRTLAALKKERAQAQAAEGLGDFLKGATGKTKEDLLDEARRGSMLNSPEQVSRFLNDARKPTFFDKIEEYWINSLLSGPKTHIANIIGNTGAMMSDIAETWVAEQIGRVRGASADKVMRGEAAARFYSISRGAREGVIAAGKAWRDELPPGERAKFSTGRNYAIEGTAGKVISTPTRALRASDQFFKALAKRQEYHAQAWRKASREGLTGEARAARIRDLVDNPTEAMIEAAEAQADYLTFTGELGPIGKTVQRLANTPVTVGGKDWRPFKFIMPFFPTIANIAKFGLERTPFGFLNPKIYKAATAAERDQALARAALGTAVSVAVASLAWEDMITGALPKDRKERAAWNLQGKQPYSVRIGDTWYSYARIEPIATVIGVAANMARAIKHLGDEDTDVLEATGNLLASMAQMVLDKTAMTGLSDFIQAIEDPDRYGQQYIGRFLGTFVPNISAQIAQATDPYLRKADGLWQNIELRLPGLSQRVPAKFDIWGNEIQREGSLGPDILSPIYERTAREDPVADALRLANIMPGQVRNKVRGVELTDEQYADYQRVAGRLLRMNLEATVSSEMFKAAQDEEKARALDHQIDRSRNAARTWLMMIHPELIAAQVEARQKAINGTAKTK